MQWDVRKGTPEAILSPRIRVAVRRDALTRIRLQLVPLQASRWCGESHSMQCSAESTVLAIKAPYF